MPTVAAPITQKELEAIKPEGKKLTVPLGGVPGLSAIVYPSGKITLSLFYRKAGAARRLTIGQYPTVTLAKGRTLAQKALNRVADDRDPAKEKREAKKAQADKLSAVAKDFIEKYHKAKGRRSWEEVERIFKVNINPILGKKALAEITRKDVVAMVDQIAEERGNTSARRAYANLRKLFGWAIGRSLIDATPCSHIELPGGESKRQRTLTDDELRLVWRGAERLEPTFRDYIRLLIVLGQRRKEVAGIARTELEDGGKLWVIPGERMKGKLAHALPLPSLALSIIEGRPKTGDHLLSTGAKKNVPVNCFSEIKADLDAAIFAIMREDAAAAGFNPDEIKPFAHWTFHDVRRTMRTNLSRLKVDPEIAERCIAHLPPGIRGVYDVYGYLPEKRAVMNKWASHLMQLVGVSLATMKKAA